MKQLRLIARMWLFLISFLVAGCTEHADDTDRNPLDGIPFDHGIVSFTFDDGWESQYRVARPILDRAGIKAGFYVVVDEMLGRGPAYMHVAQVKELYDTGHEIGSHTLTHAHLTQVPREEARYEIVASLATLRDQGMPMTNTFVYPYGEFNRKTADMVREAGYIGARMVEDGRHFFNYRDTDKFALKVHQVDRKTTLQDFYEWVDEAQKNKTWLILMYHKVEELPSGNLSVTPGMFKKMVRYLKDKNVETVTMREGLRRML